MKSISSKLFLSLVGLTGLVLIATLLLARWSFEQGFLDYVNALEQRRLQSMAEELADHYVANHNSWGPTSPMVFDGIFDKWHPIAAPPRDRRSFEGAKRRDRPPPGRSRDQSRRQLEGRPPPGNDDRARRNDDRPPPRNGHRPPHEGERQARPPRMQLPTLLLDTRGNYIAGIPNLPPNMHVVRVAVKVGDQTVGELRTVADIRADSSLETEFSEQQTRASALIAIVSLVLAGLASWVLVRMLVAPALKMKFSIEKLASGDYSTRLTTKRNDELGVLMSDIDRLAEILEENRSSRKRWLADISHELRTPVTILAGEIEAIKDGLRPMDMNQLDSLDHEVSRLRHLINDLYELSLSDIGGLRYEFKLLDPVELIESVVEQSHIRIEQSSLSVSMNVHDRAEIQADASRLEQLFTNLLNNSIAYTDKPGSVSIKVSTKNDELIIKFDDSAPGVTEAAFEQMFDPLYREDQSRSRRVAGAGLGLTISKNIVLAHQGQINACASPLGGVCMKLSFPVGKIL